MRTIFALLLAAPAVLAAPVPFLERPVPDVMLETGTPQHTQALLRWLNAADLANRVNPGHSALPPAFLAKVKAEPAAGGTRAVLRLSPSATTQERALFERLVAAVSTRQAGNPGDPAQMEMDMKKMELEQMMMRRRMLVVRGGGRAFRGGLEDADLEAYVNQMADAEIRSNPPRRLPNAGR